MGDEGEPMQVATATTLDDMEHAKTRKAPEWIVGLRRRSEHKKAHR